MNPIFKQGQPIPERVALLEQSVPRLEHSVEALEGHYNNMERDINTICVSVATMSSKVQAIIDERTVWKNPMVYISAASVIIALSTLWLASPK